METSRISDERSAPELAHLFKENRKAIKTLSRSVRVYSNAQMYLWRKIPLLAFRAFGRAPQEKTYHAIFGYWRVREWKRGSMSVYVDCITGNLVRQRAFSDLGDPREQKLSDEEVVREFPSSEALLEDLNAEEIVRKLNADCKEPFDKSRFSESELVAWRKIQKAYASQIVSPCVSRVVPPFMRGSRKRFLHGGSLHKVELGLLDRFLPAEPDGF